MTCRHPRRRRLRWRESPGLIFRFAVIYLAEHHCRSSSETSASFAKWRNKPIFSGQFASIGCESQNDAPSFAVDMMATGYRRNCQPRRSTSRANSRPEIAFIRRFPECAFCRRVGVGRHRPRGNPRSPHAHCVTVRPSFRPGSRSPEWLGLRPRPAFLGLVHHHFDLHVGAPIQWLKDKRSRAGRKLAWQQP